MPLETALLTQAWHPRQEGDPAHQWLRQTIHALCSGEARQGR